MTLGLRETVENSYQVFQKYKAIAPLDACTDCCLTKNQESELVSLAVQQISFELIYEYNTAAKTEFPSIEEFKHFLPRLLELTAQLKFPHHSAELILSQFGCYSKNQWSKEELDLIQDYAEQLFKYILTIYPLPDLEKIDSIVIMLHKAQVDMQKVLEKWHTIQQRSSLFHLSDLVCNGFKGKNHDKLASGFADDVISNLVYEWLNNDFRLIDLKQELEDIIMNPEDTSERKLNELNWTYEKLNELDYKRNQDL